MRTYTTNQYGRTVIIHLGKGEKLRKASLHVITSTDDWPVNQFITVEKPIELGAAQGLIINGEPHFHLVISEENSLYAGHMEPGCEVQYLAEFAILELLDVDLTRKTDTFGISYIDTL